MRFLHSFFSCQVFGIQRACCPHSTPQFRLAMGWELVSNQALNLKMPLEKNYVNLKNGLLATESKPAVTISRLFPVSNPSGWG